MISIVITAFREPHVGKAIEAIIRQKISEKYELIVAAPDKETSAIISTYAQKHKQIKYFRDPGKGKSYALNEIFKILKGRIWIFTDGDVYLEDNSINELIKKFKDIKIGVVSGRVVATDSRNNMYGYWAHLLADAGAHEERLQQEKTGFLEATGYLFAFRRDIIKEIPLNVAEDAYIPYFFYNNGYKIGYAPAAKVYVKNPNTFKDWLKQRVRTAKAHETLERVIDTSRVPRIKSFKNELLRGPKRALSYPQTTRELFWTFALFGARLIMWLNVYKDSFLKKQYTDAWERVESAR